MTELFAIGADAQDTLFRDAHTVNAFTDEPVTDAQLEAIHDLVKWGPTLMNTQPLRIVAVRTDDARERLVTHLAEGNRAKTATAPLVVVLAADTAFHDTMDVVFPHNPAARERFAADPERRDRVAREQAWLQAGYFIVGIRAMGLAAGPMAGFDADGVDADLLAGTALRSFLVVNIGHEAQGGHRPRQPRLDAGAAIITV